MGEMTKRVATAIADYWEREGFDPSEPSIGAARAAIEAMRDYLNITSNSSLNYTADELDAELRESA